MLIRPFHFLILSLAILLLCNSPLHAATYTTEDDVVGAVRHYTVKTEDNLYAIARRFDIGIVELLSANPGVDPWTPEAGTKLTITNAHILPAVPHKGIVLNLSELRLFYFVDDRTIMTFPIGIGREGWETPMGTTKIVLKRKDPEWIPPESILEENPNLPEVIPAGPDNPLGAYALNLNWPSYAIHGTNRPYGVGKRSSHGCIRLYPEDIKTLFDAVELGTPVTVIDTPFKLGWRGGVLFLEVTPTQEQSDTIAKYRRPMPLDIPEIHDEILKIAPADTIDWYAVDHAVKKRNGIPTAISHL